MLRAVLFDVGGVIIGSPLDAFARYEHEARLPRGFVTHVLRQDPGGNAWARHERGEIDADTFVADFEAESRREGHALEARRLLELMRSDVHPEMVEAVRRLHDAGLLVGLLTNNFPGGDAPGALRRPELAEVARLADAVVESSRVGVRKPEAAFYRIACERLRISPEEAVFLDDLGMNLKPARAMGMTTVKVTDPVDALRQLQELVGVPLVPPGRG